MISSCSFFSPAARRVRRGLILGVLALLTTCALAPALLAQDAPPSSAPAAADAPPPAPDAQMPGGGNGNGNGGDTSDRAARRGRRGNFTPEAMLAALKTRFGVTDDAEWAIISARITAIMDLRRGAGGGFPGGFRGGDNNNRQGNTGNPELDALRSAVTDNMPDAEIKARLDRFREVRKDSEAKLEKARADLQAVLSVKQEAVAVMMGLLQ